MGVLGEGQAALHCQRLVSGVSPAVVLEDAGKEAVDLEATQEQSGLVWNGAAAGSLAKEEW